MRDELFEWDDAKAIRNYAKHGVSFRRARLAFSDAFAVEGVDDRDDFGEDRFWLVGMAEGTLLYVVYTERDGRARIISARQATRHEQDDYYQQNAQGD